MSTKAQSTKSKERPIKPKKGYLEAKPTVSFARQGHQLASLLWQKILASSTPEVCEMLFVHSRLDWIWDQLAPNDLERVMHGPLTFEALRDNMGKAEFLLTGATYKNTNGLRDGYEMGRDDERAEEALMVDGALYKQLYNALSDEQREILDQIYTYPTKDAEPFRLYGWLKRAWHFLSAEDKKIIEDLMIKTAGR